MTSPTTCYSRYSCRFFGRGFTLIELLIVVAVIAILAALTLSVMGGVNRKAAMSRTRVEVAAIVNALEQYKSVNDDYPATLTAVDGAPESLQPFLVSTKLDISSSGQVLDAFGNAYNYRKPGTKNPASFDVWSDGADSQSDDDNIGNW